MAEDAEGLVQANKPDFDLDVNEVTELLGRRVAENMHLTTSGRRLRLAPSPVMPALFERASAPVLPAVVAPLVAAQPERSRSTTELAMDIDAKRQQMLEKFASELRGAVGGNNSE